MPSAKTAGCFLLSCRKEERTCSAKNANQGGAQGNRYKSDSRQRVAFEDPQTRRFYVKRRNTHCLFARFLLKYISYVWENACRLAILQPAALHKARHGGRKNKNHA